MKRADGIGDGESGHLGSKKARLLLDSVSDDLQGLGLGGLNKSNKWDGDINSDLNFGDDDEWQDGLAFDLNLPAVKDNRVAVIDIGSDDEVEVIGYNNAGGNLSLGRGMFGMSNFFGASSTNGERRYTREEKGKANVADSWLSLRPNSPTVFHLFPGIYDPIKTSEPREKSPERPEMAESSIGPLRQAEEDLRRETADREFWKETAKIFALTHLQDENDEKEPLPAASPVDQLGNCPGAFSDALRIFRERTSRRPAVIEWKPSMRERSITTPFVPSLLDLSLKTLAENAERIVSLELVPDNLRERLSDRLCDTSKMNVHAMNLLIEGCATEIRIKNCSWLTEQQFQKIFGSFRTKQLRVLQLELCGQCMFDFAFKDLLSHSPNSFSNLAILSLRGACRLSDGGLKALLMSAPLLRSINLGHCNLLTSNAISFIVDTLGSNLRELYIDDCQKINPMLILPAFNKFLYLEVLSVARIHSITDQFIREIVTACGRSIKELDLADCLKLTDCSMKSIGSNCTDLSSLNISNLPNLTDLGMEYLANGCRSIRKLKLCRNEFSDEAMAAYIESSGESLTELVLNHLTKMGPNTAMSLAKCSRKLSSLDVSWCRRITNEALGLIVDSCASLKLLKVFGCRQITNVFLNGHSNPGVRIIGLSFTSILDHVNLLEPKGVLLRYSAIPNSQ